MSLSELIKKRKDLQSKLRQVAYSIDTYLEEHLSAPEGEEQDYIIVNDTGEILLTCKIENNSYDYICEQDSTLDVDMHTGCIVVNVGDI